MKKLSVRLLSVILAALVIVPMTGCSETTTDEEKTDSGSSAVTEEAGGTVVEEEIPYVETLEAKNFEGYEYTMLAQHTASRPNFGTSDEITGEAVNDSVFQRRQLTEDRLNIKVIELAYEDRGQLQNDAAKTISAGDNAYDVILTALSDGINNLTSKKLFLDLTTVPYLTLDGELWNKSMAESMRIGGKQFFTTGVTSVSFLLTPQLVMFNKELAAQYNLPDLYSLVLEGKWTIDKMNELMQGHALDLNGDGVLKPEDDRFALVDEGTFGNALYMAAGLDTVIQDASGDWILNIGCEAAINLIDKCAPIFSDPALVYQDVNAADQVLYARIFTEGRTLFISGTVSHATSYREMENDFGVLPIPVLNEGDELRNSCNTWLPSGIGVPITADNLERTGLIMETMAAYSYDYILPAVCEKTLGKTARDAESYRILEMIYECTAFDFNTIMDFGGSSSLLRSAMIGGTENFASQYAKLQKIANKNLDKFVKDCTAE